MGGWVGGQEWSRPRQGRSRLEVCAPPGNCRLLFTDRVVEACEAGGGECHRESIEVRFLHPSTAVDGCSLRNAGKGRWADTVYGSDDSARACGPDESCRSLGGTWG